MLRGQTRMPVTATSTCVVLAQGLVHRLWEQVCHAAQLQTENGPVSEVTNHIANHQVC